MSYRNITVDGHVYKYKVGRSNIEIRSADTPENFKKILHRPLKQERWGVISPDVEAASGIKAIQIFTFYPSAAAEYQNKQNCHPASEVELVKLPAKTVAITPGWIEEAIRKILSLSQAT